MSNWPSATRRDASRLTRPNFDVDDVFDSSQFNILRTPGRLKSVQSITQQFRVTAEIMTPFTMLYPIQRSFYNFIAIMEILVVFMAEL